MQVSKENNFKFAALITTPVIKAPVTTGTNISGTDQLITSPYMSTHLHRIALSKQPWPLTVQISLELLSTSPSSLYHIVHLLYLIPSVQVFVAYNTSGSWAGDVSGRTSPI